uniref:Condensin-2 complex subunit H2 n=1 Tax=Ficedula albicollis TaxID=59894 RepID=A0A803V6Q5_FICAL
MFPMFPIPVPVPIPVPNIPNVPNVPNPRSRPHPCSQYSQCSQCSQSPFPSPSLFPIFPMFPMFPIPVPVPIPVPNIPNVPNVPNPRSRPHPCSQYSQCSQCSQSPFPSPSLFPIFPMFPMFPIPVPVPIPVPNIPNVPNVPNPRSRRSAPADLEVLYWRHFKERMAAHRKLRSSRVSGEGAKLGGWGAPAAPSPALGGAQGVSGLVFPQELQWEPEQEQELEQERGADSEEGAGAGTPNPKSPLPGEPVLPSWGACPPLLGGLGGVPRGTVGCQGTLSAVPILADDDFVEHEDVEPEAPEEQGEGSLGPPESGYEDLVRRNVELFMASSQKFVQETELSRHIRLWEEHVEPLLQEQAGPWAGLEPLGWDYLGWAGTPPG